MNRQEAIREVQEMWEWMAETGDPEKSNYPGMKEWLNDCPLCEVSEDCSNCPYCERFGCCIKKKKPYARWRDAKTTCSRKYWARKFLAQLMELE
jgi:hypothetical protein